MRRHLGYYAHHHGSGHVRRAEQVLERCRTPGTLLTSSERAAGPDVVHLPLDVGGPTAERPLPSFLHHAPVGHRGLRERTARIARWFVDADPAALVVDVSVEVTLLARLTGVLPVVVRQHGDRTDAPHRAAYEAAGALLAFWPAWADDGATPAAVRDRTHHVGGTSRLAGRSLPRAQACAQAGLDADERHVVVLRGFGGDRTTLDDLVAAARATPDHRWTVVGEAPPAAHAGAAPHAASDPQVLDVRGAVDDPVALLSAADVLVTHGGQNAVADAAAVGARLVVVPQPRPFDEQLHLASVLAANGCAVVRPSWPRPTDWPAVLTATEQVDRDRLRSYVDDGAGRAAAILDGLVDELVGGAPAVAS